MTKIGRLILNNLLAKQFRALKPGLVLDVGSKNSPYKELVPKTRYLRLDICPQSDPDIVADIHKVNRRGDSFDTIIAIQTLEHTYNPQKAINEIRRLLKTGGTFIASVPFIYKYHPDPKDYFRFTHDSLEYLFRYFKKIKIIPYGNRFQAVWELLSSAGLSPVLDLFNPLIAKINFHDEFFPLGFVVVAVK